MCLLDKLKEYKNICYYMSSGNDFYIIYELFQNNIDSDLIIMSEIYPENFSNLDNMFSYLNYDLSDNVVHNYKINVLNIFEYKLDLKIDNRTSDRISKHNNEVRLLNIEFIKNDIRINKDILFVVSENLTFSINFLIKNNISVNTLYIHGYKGSSLTLDSIVLLFDKLKTKLYITNDIYLGYKEDVVANSVFSKLKEYKKKSLKQIHYSNYNMTYFKVIDYSPYKYKICSLKDYTFYIDDEIFKIDIGVYNSSFLNDTYINGILYKKNSDNNIIGLDIILKTGLVIENSYLMFKSGDKRGLKYKHLKAYEKNYLLINDKFLTNNASIPASLSLIDIREKYIIKDKFEININEGEIVL